MNYISSKWSDVPVGRLFVMQMGKYKRTFMKLDPNNPDLKNYISSTNSPNIAAGSTIGVAKDMKKNVVVQITIASSDKESKLFDLVYFDGTETVRVSGMDPNKSNAPKGSLVEKILSKEITQQEAQEKVNAIVYAEANKKDAGIASQSYPSKRKLLS